MIKYNSDIINRLFFREFQTLVNKYNNIDEYNKTKIEEIITNLNDEDLESYLINNPDKLTEMIKEKDLDESLIIFFTWLNSNVKEISIDKAKEYIYELKLNNYLQIEDNIIYRDERYLKEYAKEFLEDRLEYQCYVNKIFTKDQLIEMWIEGICKQDMITEIIHNDDLEEVLELYPQDAFMIEGIKYSYSQIEE